MTLTQMKIAFELRAGGFYGDEAERHLEEMARALSDASDMINAGLTRRAATRETCHHLKKEAAYEISEALKHILYARNKLDLIAREVMAKKEKKT